MKKIIDIHSHILPGVDDGCGSEVEALRMLKMYESQNVEAVICTPHFGPCAITGADVKGAMSWIKTTSSPVNLYLGNEILVSRHTLDDVIGGKANTMAGSDHILVEFEEWGEFMASESEIMRGLQKLADSEYTPILAHAERYTSLQLNPALYAVITNIGVKIQVNAYDIAENKNTLCRSTAQNLLRNGFVSFIGSDAHGDSRRSPKLTSGVEWIYANCPTEYADAVVHDNAEKLIKKGEA